MSGEVRPQVHREAHWGAWSLALPGEATAPALLAPDEPAPFEIVNADGATNALLVCDHASNRVPRRLAGLGLTPELLERHIAWDPGAEAVARALAARLDAPLILSRWSRLAIDLNRPLASPELIPERSDGIPIPGNRGLTAPERAARIADLFIPYHRAIARWLDAHPDPGLRLLSLHSFAPRLAGVWRPWSVGLAYGRDARLAAALHRILDRHWDLVVGDNRPYRIEDAHDFTLPTHGERRGIPHVMIEIRQDGLREPAQVAAWVERLAQSYERVREDPLGDRQSRSNR